MINGLDILLLLKLSLKEGPRIPSKSLAEEIFVTPVEVSHSLRRCQASGLLHLSDLGKLVNRSGLFEFLSHGLRYVFPAERGSMTRGIPTGAAAEPLKSMFLDNGEPPPVWPYADGTIRGIALTPLHRQVPRAALRDSGLYALLTLVDSIRSDRIRERKFAIEELRKRMNQGD
jgi:hypothetical protein